MNIKRLWMVLVLTSLLALAGCNSGGEEEEETESSEQAATEEEGEETAEEPEEEEVAEEETEETEGSGDMAGLDGIEQEPPARPPSNFQLQPVELTVPNSNPAAPGQIILPNAGRPQIDVPALRNSLEQAGE